MNVPINSNYLLVMAGGAFGSLARYIASSSVSGQFSGRFPFGTLFVNIAGCFLIGALMPFLGRPSWRLLIVIGFLGGFTTFSSFAYETYLSIRSGNVFAGLVNVIASVTLGYLAVWLGAVSVGRR